MTATKQTLEVFCDEAGSTGPAMLDKDQRFFAFSSLAISEAEARLLVEDARRRFPVQMPELKSAKLLKTASGRRLIRHLLSGLDGRYAVTVHDKVLALCAQFFEYIFEPVFQESPWILYEKKMNLFVALVLFVWFRGKEQDAEQALHQFQSYIRTFDPRQAPLLFGAIALSEPLGRDPLQSIVRFARAVRKLVIADNAAIPSQLPAEGKWLTDLSTTSLWAHLNHWGASGRPLRVVCDESKPLEAQCGEFTGDDADPGIRRARMKNHQGALGWRLESPIQFANSKDHFALQIADVIAGTATYAIRDYVAAEPDVAFFKAELRRHVLMACILPDFHLIDPAQKHAAVNAAVLYRLADKAEHGQDPTSGLETDYLFAEQAWDAGGFKMG